ncbi:regulatory signaling modulator protein AmpE, partial [Klebsiella quasipneumoniae]
MGGGGGPLALIAYCVLRAGQGWRARCRTPRHRLQCGIGGVMKIV